MSSASACIVAALLLFGANALEDAEKRDSRDSYLDAYVDSQGSAPEKESPPKGVVEAASNPNVSDTYDTLPVQSYKHQYPPTGYSTMAYSAPSYKVPVLPPNSFSATSYGVPIHPALPLDYGTPSPSYGKPSSYGNSAQSFNQPGSTYSPPDPKYSQPAPTYNQPPPTYSQPAPTYDQPPPTYSQPPPTYDQPPPTYTHPSPSYSTPSPSYGPPTHYGTPAPKYGPPAHSYGPPSPTYGTPAKVPHPVTSYGPPDRGMGGIPFHTILQILLKVLIFKAIVKFIAIVCVMLFLPKFDLGHGHKDDEMRRSSIDHVTKEKLDSLTKLVSEGIGRRFDETECNGDAFCRLVEVSKRVDREYTLMRLMTIFLDEYFDDDRRPDVSPAVPTLF